MLKKRLLTSFLALLLIIKLIKIKIMYVLPIIIGVNAAKKLLLKTLLFLFPPLVHLFKLCTYYHAHASKLHFHHHKIKHHHHHIKVPVPVPVPVPASIKPHGVHDTGGYLGPDDLDAPGPLPLDDPHSGYASPYGGHSPYGADSLVGGYSENHPDYYTRNDNVNVANEHGDELASWGLKDFYASTESPGVLSAQAQAYSPYAEQNYKAYLQQAQAQAQAAAAKASSSLQKKNKGSTISSWKSKPASVGSDNIGSAVKTSMAGPYDHFYSPILQKIDTIFTGLGFNDEGCRERLICSMYKDPQRFSPHSNLISTELSRDPAELERPSPSNMAAVRFYKYVEAARDGQSQKDCLSLYNICTVKTE